MPKQFKAARQINKLKAVKAAEKLGISQPTLSAWESERKSPSIDSLENMANLYGVTTDFLLGRSATHTPDSKRPIPLQALPAFHGRPVWSAAYGWLLVNAADRLLTFPDGHALPFTDMTGDLFSLAPPFSETEPPKGQPLSRFEVSGQKEIWLEPISPDSGLREELQGWYQVKARYVENEYGNRFYLDTYGAKWLAFPSESKA
ncbi:XRE family transcriptional regulator [Lachnospiraceae bacterium]|nr:XRE family transcriptional regulator [Lachnospiraceae bacterium]